MAIQRRKGLPCSCPHPFLSVRLYATLRWIGFAKRSDCAAIGTVTNLAGRLCAEAAAGQILLSQRVAAAIEGTIATRLLEDRALKGLHAPVPVYELAT